MLECNETITFVRLIKGKTSDTYTCTVVNGASWYEKRITALQDNGLASATEVKVRIPTPNMPSDFIPLVGDFVCRGTVESIAKQADLQAYTHFRVLAVGDNRRGHLSHWAVSGS